MADILILMAGVLGMIIAVVHGVLGARKVVGPIEGAPPSAKRIMHAIMFLSAVYWFIGGAALALAPLYFDAEQKRLAVTVVSAMYGTGAAANFWATRGRHFGWMLLILATGLAVAGGIMSG